METVRRRRGSARGALALLLYATGIAVAPAVGAGAEGAQAGTAPPEVGLEQLLKLPDSLDYSIESRAGSTRGEWRARFEALRTSLAEEKAALEKDKTELEELAGAADAWNVGPPIPGVGAGTGDGPLDYRLGQRIRRHREEIQRLERQLLALKVEANLADVPDDWRN